MFSDVTRARMGLVVSTSSSYHSNRAPNLEYVCIIVRTICGYSKSWFLPKIVH